MACTGHRDHCGTTMPKSCDRKARGRERGKHHPTIVRRNGTYSYTRNPTRSSFSRVGMTAQQTTQVTSRLARDEMGALENKAYVMIANFSEESLTIPISSILRVAEPVSEAWINEVNPGNIQKGQ